MSLADELRAIRGGIYGKSLSMRQNRPGENERPWKSDIERVEQTLQEALQTISQFSGVDLTEGVAPPTGEGGSVSRLDCATLKERIRNDLKTFSATTVSEMAKEAEQQARAALEVIQIEMEGRIEKVVDGYRDKLREQIEPTQFEINVEKQSQERVAELVRAQTDEFARWVWLTCKGTGTPIPMQIEKLLEPYVEQATALVTGSMEQKIQDMLAEQEKLAEERFQGTADSHRNQIASLEQAAQQICEKNADAVTKLSTERLNAAAAETAKSFESGIHEQMEGSFSGIETRLNETAAALMEQLRQEQEQEAQDFIRRMKSLATDLEEKKGPELSARLEETAAKAMESSRQQLQQTAEGILQQIQEAGRSVQESVQQGVTKVQGMLAGEGQDLSALREKVLEGSREQISSMAQEAMRSMEPRVLQLAEERIQAATAEMNKSQDETVAQFESRLREVSEGQYHNLLDRIQKDTSEASARAAEEVRSASGPVMQELTQKVEAASALLRKQQEEASSGFQSSVNETLETFRKQLSEISNAGIEGQRKSISNNLNELQKRLTLAAEALLTDPPLLH